MWITGSLIFMGIPTRPGAYWRPTISLTDVYHLRRNGTWWVSPDGVNLSVQDVPADLMFLAPAT